MHFFQHLEDYQRRLDLSYLKQSEDPMMDEFRVSHDTEVIAQCTIIATLLFNVWLFLLQSSDVQSNGLWHIHFCTKVKVIRFRNLSFAVFLKISVDVTTWFCI